MFASRPDVAKSAFRNAIDILKAAYGEDHPYHARALVSLASVLLSEKDAVAASEVLTKAIQILEKADPDKENRGYLARAYNSLAMISKRDRRNDDAEMLLKKAIDAWKEAGRDVDRAITLDNLAMMLKGQGRFDEADPFSAEAVTVLENKLGPKRNDTIFAKANRASLLVQLGRASEAMKLLEQNLDNSFALFEASAVGASERDRMMAFNRWRGLLDAYLSLAVSTKAPAEEVYPRVIQWKSAVFGRQRADRFARQSPELIKNVENARRAVSNLATLCVTIPDSNGTDEWRASIRRASAERDAAERNLAIAVKGWKEKSAEVNGGDWNYMPPDLPEGSIFIDFFQYRDFSPQDEDETLHLLAFIASPNSAVKFIDLGKCSALNKAIDDWREVKTSRISSIQSRDVDDPLLGLVSKPLSAALRDAKLILSCPDGPITRIPLAALPHPTTSRPLLESALVVTVPHLSQLPDRAILGQWIKPYPADSKTAVRPVKAPSFMSIGSLTYGPPAKSGFSFNPLVNSGMELDAVGASFKSAFGINPPTPLKEEAATKSAVKDTISGKEVIHVVTHGFIIPESQLDQIMRADEQVERRLAIGQGGTPREWRSSSLLGSGIISGIALSGANNSYAKKSETGSENNLLSAAEVTLLNLTNTRLAILSACDTGSGEAAEAEAVLGLQRAFHVAGAESVIASLWKVDDAATAQLMTSFYNWYWVKRVPAPVALRKAQLDLMTGSSIGKGQDREPDFSGKNDPMTGKGNLSKIGDKTRLWAAFTISYCKDDSVRSVEKP